MPSPKFWSELKQIIRENNNRRANSNGPTSFETQARRAEIIHQGFRILWELGCRLPSPWGFRERHMHKLGRYWESKGYKDIQTRFSAFRTFGNDWLKRPSMIKASSVYVDNPESVKRKYVSNVDRTWSGNGVDFVQKIEEVTQYDQRVGVILELCLVMGLRISESTKFRPKESIADDHVNILRGAKNGRSRTIQIEDGHVGALQREVLEKAIALVSPRSPSMIPADQTFASYRDHIYYVCRKFGITSSMLGVTPHGLRHEYAVAYFERYSGEKAPVRGPAQAASAADHSDVRKALSENLGHSRESIVGCYIGSSRVREEESP